MSAHWTKSAVRRAIAAAPFVTLPACSSGCTPADNPPTSDRADERAAMIDHIRSAYRFDDERVLAALAEVPRHRFVAEPYDRAAYADQALPLGHGQTISQPFIVAAMSSAVGLGPGARVLEIGTGSGYQAAVLAALGARVFSIEIVRPLGERAARVLDELGYHSVELRIGDGYRGWPEQAPFDAIVVTAAPDHVPEPLLEQLRIGGRLAIPVGDRQQELLVITRTEHGYDEERLMGVRFVPMTGQAEDPGR